MASEPEKIILYYKFVPVADPKLTMLWQRELCLHLELKGRIIISQHGINGTLGGLVKNLKAYKKAMTESGTFKDINYKWSNGGAADFPRLSVKVRKELVTLNPEEDFDVFNTGKALKPKAWHDYLAKHPDAIVFDARNSYESEIGVFKNAIAPPIKNFRDIKPELEKLPKDKPVLTYCTGDIRCEYLTSYMKHKGFKEVYHLDGGVVKYGQAFADDGFWEGACYVFDKRRHIKFSSKAKQIGVCKHCRAKTSSQTDCLDPSCHQQIVVCDSCIEQQKTSCPQHATTAAQS